MDDGEWSIVLEEDGRPNELGIALHDEIPPWVVEVFLNGDSGETIVSEVRVVAPVDGVRLLPAGGLGSQLGKLNISRLKSRAMAAARELTMQEHTLVPPEYKLPEVAIEKHLSDLGSIERLRRAAESKGMRYERDPWWLATVAAHYVLLAAESQSVVPTLANAYGLAHETVRDIVKQCRADGLLTSPAISGRAGGQLTEKAQRLLEAEDV